MQGCKEAFEGRFDGFWNADFVGESLPSLLSRLKLLS